MQYSVRNRRRLRQTAELGVSRTVTARGTGVAAAAEPQVVHAEGSGPIVVKEIVPAAIIKQNWQR